MQIRTPKRYTGKARRKPIISLRWLWLYLLAPVVIIGGALAWDYRDQISQQISVAVSKIKLPNPNAPTATPTLPAADLQAQIQTGLQTGDIDGALAAMHAYNDSNPNDVQWHAVLTQILALRAYGSDTKMLQQAIQAGQSAINANPELGIGWAVEALALDWNNQSRLALGDALHAVDLDDSNGFAQAVLAGVYNSLGKPDAASAMADQALKKNPNLAYALFVKGQIAALDGDTKGAIALYRQAWDISQSDPNQWGGYIADYLAGLYTTQNQFDDAQAILNQAQQHDKNDPQPSWRLSDMLYKQGEYDKATEAAQQCLDRAQQYAPCYVLLTRLYYIAKAYEKAVQAAQNAIKYGTTSTAAYYYGGESDYKLNNCAGALQMLQTGYEFAQKANDPNSIADFADALNQCGVTVNPNATPFPTPTAAASAKP